MLEQEGYDLMGAAFEVYNEMAPGFLEEIYQECLDVELKSRGIPFEAQPALNVCYKNENLKKTYRPDLFVFDGIVVELKAVKKLLPEHEAQLINYLKVTNKKVGYLINFGNPSELEWKRIILN